VKRGVNQNFLQETKLKSDPAQKNGFYYPILVSYTESDESTVLICCEIHLNPEPCNNSPLAEFLGWTLGIGTLYPSISDLEDLEDDDIALGPHSDVKTCDRFRLMMVFVSKIF